MGQQGKGTMLLLPVTQPAESKELSTSAGNRIHVLSKH